MPRRTDEDDRQALKDYTDERVLQATYVTDENKELIQLVIVKDQLTHLLEWPGPDRESNDGPQKQALAWLLDRVKGRNYVKHDKAHIVPKVASDVVRAFFDYKDGR
jgi:hypothetical protein